jgi:hypothetical protein
MLALKASCSAGIRRYPLTSTSLLRNFSRPVHFTFTSSVHSLALVVLNHYNKLYLLFKMLFKSVLLSGAILAFSATEVWAHAAINPALGVKGTAVRNDVQRPSANKPCGNAALTAIDTSTAVKADASGSFTVDIQNFNG